MMMRCLALLFLTATGFGQATAKPREDAQPLGNERVWVDLAHNAGGAAILQVWFVGSDGEIVYGDVGLKPFNQRGEELPVRKSISTDAKYTNMRVGRYKSDANFGLYTLGATDDEVAKVSIDWKGGHVEFAPVHRLKHMDFKPIHGGEAGVSIIKVPNDEQILNVLLKGVMLPQVNYDEIHVSALDEAGKPVAIEPAFKGKGGYILGSKEHGVFTGRYRFKDNSTAVARVTIQWTAEEIEFTQF